MNTLDQQFGMGARQYSSLLGRFLEVDPVLGGNANDYAYVSDPVGMSDLDGLCGVWGNPRSKCGKRRKGQRGFLGGAFSKGGRLAYRHLGVSVQGCAAVCAGLNFQHGHLYFERGGGAIFGGGIAPSFHSRPLSEASKGSCSQTRTFTYQGFFAGFQHSSKQDWSVSAFGYKGIVGLGVLCSSRIR